MPRQLFIAIIAVVGLAVGPQESWAQGRTTGGSASGAFGNRNLGSGISAGNRSFGGASATPGNLTTQAQGEVGQVDANARYVRGQRQAGQFVGSDSAEVQQFLGAIQAGQTGAGQNALQRITNRNNGSNNANQGRNAGGRGGRGTTDIRVSLSVGFAQPAATPATRAAGFAQHMADNPRMKALGPVSVEVRQETAILRGVVASDHDRALCEQLALLEPGIWAVQNELEVRPAPIPPPAP